MEDEMFNYVTGDYDDLENLPDDVDGLIQYIPDVAGAHNLFKLYVEHEGLTPTNAYIKVMKKVVGDIE